MNGNVLRTVQEENDAWLRMFSPAQRKKVYQNSLMDALGKWRKEFLWRRVNATEVKKSPFNYRLGGDTPMIGNNRGNRKLINTIGNGKITVRVPSANKETAPLQITGTIAFPTGHPVPPEIRAVFSIIPPDEIRWIARQWQRNLDKIRQKAGRVTRGVNAGRFKLTPEQTAAMKEGRARRGVSGRSLRGRR